MKSADRPIDVRAASARYNAAAKKIPAPIRFRNTVKRTNITDFF